LTICEKSSKKKIRVKKEDRKEKKTYNKIYMFTDKEREKKKKRKGDR
jgi:hypothetical protein